MNKIDTTKSVWYERYKPQCVDDLVIPDVIKKQIKEYTKTQDIPNLGLFSSNPGTGKSSTAHAIIKEIGGEALWINASMEKGIDVLRGKIGKFASQSSFDDNIKIVVMDEFDHFTKDGQAAFRGFIDEFSQNCRFIFTGNYKEKIIEPLMDRLEVYDFNSFNKEELIKPIFERLRFILDNEKITYEPRDIVPIINTYYPRIRSMVGTLQKFSKDGEFALNENELDDVNAFDTIMKLATKSTYNELMQEIMKLNAPDNMYSYLFKYGDKYFTQQEHPGMIVAIAHYQGLAGNVRDKNLNLAACIVQIKGLNK